MVQRGFKTWAEKQAVLQRQQLGLRPEAPLVARRLAAHLGIIVVGPESIPGVTPALLHQLLRIDPSSWSAATVSCNGCTAIIHNTAHDLSRQESDLMHELSHVLCKHPPARIVPLDGMAVALREYRAAHEDEATWLGGCLQIPRPALLWAIQRGMDEAAMVEHFGASDKMVQYRRNMTAVDIQLARGRGRRW